MATSEEEFLNELTPDEAQAILQASMSILRQESFPVVAKNVFQGLKEQIGAKAGYVALLSDDGMENEIVYLDPGHYDCRVDESLPMPIRGFRAVVYESGRAQYCNDFDHTEYKGLMPDGHVRLRNVMFTPLILEGKARGLLGLSNKEGDFTDRDAMLAEHFGRLASLALYNSFKNSALEASETRCRHLIEGAFDAMVSIDQDGKVIFFNDAFRRLLRLSDGEMLGKGIDDLLKATEKPEAEGIHKVKAALPDGRQASLEVSVSKTIMGGEDVQVLVIRDVTKSEALERRMRLVDRKMELMGKVTRHDVLNHIMVVQGFLELSHDSGQPLSERHFDRINEALERMKSLYSLQREFEALGTAAAEWVDLEESMRRARSLLAQDSSGVEFRIGVQGMVWADPLFDKVLYNLVQNSLQHGEKVSFIGIEAVTNGNEVLIDVYDDGVGVPEADKRSIFSLGFGKNTGQGLFLVKEILDTYGMSVDEIGSPGQGARFRIHVPIGSWRLS